MRKVQVETDTYAFNDPSGLMRGNTSFTTRGDLCNDSEVEARPVAEADLRGREEPASLSLRRSELVDWEPWEIVDPQSECRHAYESLWRLLLSSPVTVER
jgi:hypothetical protein